MILLFEQVTGGYKIKWYSTATKYSGQIKYFKVENVSGTYYPFCDASSEQAATWTLEPVVTGDISITVLGTTDEAAGVVYKDAEYKNGSTLNTNASIKKEDLTAMPVDGMHAVINIDDQNIYVSYFYNSTKFYTVKGHKVDLYYLSLNPDYCDGVNLKLTNKNVPQDNRGKSVVLSSTMGPGVKINPLKF